MRDNLKKILIEHIDKIVSIIFIGFFFLSYFIFGERNHFEFIERQIVDALQAQFEYKEPQKDISIVAVDTKSIDKIGRWPWTRDTMAELVEVLNKHYDARSIGFDMVFSEEDKNLTFLESGLVNFVNRVSQSASFGNQSDLLNYFDSTKKKVIDQNNTDLVFAEVMKSSQNTILGYLFFSETEQVEHMTKKEITDTSLGVSLGGIVVSQGDTSFIPDTKAIENNIPFFQQNNPLSGHFTMIADTDGIVRKANLLLRFQGKVYPSIDLQMLRLYHKEKGAPLPQVYVDMSDGGVAGIRIQKQLLDENGELADIVEIPIRTNPDGSIHINYMGPVGAYKTHSFVDVIEKIVPVEELQGHNIYIGVTELGVFDVRATPVDNQFPGVEIHNNILDNLINNKNRIFIHNGFNGLVSVIVLILVAFIFRPIFKMKNYLLATSMALFILAAYLAVDVWILFNQNTWFSFAGMTVFTFLKCFTNGFSRYYREEGEKQFIKNTFQRYLAPELIDQIIKDPSLLKLGGQKLELTVLFSDVAGFTSMSEKLGTEETLKLMNEYLDEMTQVVLEQGGTLDKYIGDAIMVFYGAPTHMEDHASRACITAIKMLRRLGTLNERLAQRGQQSLRFRLGINTGDMIVGNVGSTLKMDYTVMGDPVNLGSRLEGVNKAYKTNMMISEFTYEKAKDYIEAMELDKVKVVGKDEPVRIYELLDEKGKLTPEQAKWRDKFQDTLLLFRDRKWDEAKASFASLKEEKGESYVCDMYIQRCDALKASPPPKDWDGSAIIQSK